jgi:hypothetical protein
VHSGKVQKNRETVNQEIIRTIAEQPEMMLARNNGVTFRATKVIEADERSLRLERAAIVNGCQTTMCLVHSSSISEECLVPVKVVVAADAWDIAKAANNQNPIARVDLDLARYLRPQLVRKFGAAFGYAISFDVETSAAAVLNAVHRSKVEYEELRLLYLGLFSRRPNNIFESNYAEIRADVLEGLYFD